MFRSIKSTMQIAHAVLFKQNNFKCKVDANKEYEFVIWERPGVWCTKEEIGEIKADLNKIASLGQGDKDVPVYGVLSDDDIDFSQRIITIVYHKKSKSPIGFSAQIYFDVSVGHTQTSVLHIGLMYIIPEHRGKSIARITYLFPTLILLLKSGLRPIWVSSVSQVPSMIGVVAESFVGVYPHPLKKRKQRYKYKVLGEEIMANYRHAFGVGEEAGYDADAQIITNGYTGGSDNLKKTFKEAMKHRNERVNKTCEELLDYDRGDDFLQIGILNKECILKVLKNSLSKGTFAQIGFMVALLFFSFLTPIIRWLVPPQDDDFKYNGQL